MSKKDKSFLMFFIRLKYSIFFLCFMQYILNSLYFSFSPHFRLEFMFYIYYFKSHHQHSTFLVTMYTCVTHHCIFYIKCCKFSTLYFMYKCHISYYILRTSLKFSVSCSECTPNICLFLDFVFDVDFFIYYVHCYKYGVNHYVF